jgi:hypothetical protein
MMQAQLVLDCFQLHLRLLLLLVLLGVITQGSLTLLLLVLLLGAVTQSSLTLLLLALLLRAVTQGSLVLCICVGGVTQLQALQALRGGQHIQQLRHCRRLLKAGAALDSHGAEAGLAAGLAPPDAAAGGRGPGWAAGAGATRCLGHPRAVVVGHQVSRGWHRVAGLLAACCCAGRCCGCGCVPVCLQLTGQALHLLAGQYQALGLCGC